MVMDTLKLWENIRDVKYRGYPLDQLNVTGTQNGTKFGMDVNIIGGNIDINSTINSENSTDVALSSNETFVGPAIDITNYSSINILLKSNVDSAVNGLSVEFSPDGINWDHSHSITYTSNSGKGFVFNCEGQYARVKYTNGPIAQSYFRLQTLLKTTKLQSSLFTLNQSLTSDLFAELNRSVITGESTAGGGGYHNVKVTPSGAVAAELGGSLPDFENTPAVNIAISADTDNIETRKMAMKKAVDEASDTVTYIGEAALGSALSSAVWRIKRLTVSGTVTITEWAGTGVFDQVWNNRTSLTYN